VHIRPKRVKWLSFGKCGLSKQHSCSGQMISTIQQTMGNAVINIHKFQNNRMLTAACKVDGTRMTRNFKSYVLVQRTWTANNKLHQSHLLNWSTQKLASMIILVLFVYFKKNNLHHFLAPISYVQK
jgi:hypothetical protein